MRVLVTAASKHGSTWEIAGAIGDMLAVQGIDADVVHMEDVGDLSMYDAFVVGSAVYAGHWLRRASAFVRHHASEFAGRPVWLFSSGPLAPPSSQDGIAPDVRRAAKFVRLKEHRTFAGRLKKRRLGLAEKVIATAVHAPQGDFRNWVEIRAWAVGIAKSLQRQAARRAR